MLVWVLKNGELDRERVPRQHPHPGKEQLEANKRMMIGDAWRGMAKEHLCIYFPTGSAPQSLVANPDNMECCKSYAKDYLADLIKSGKRTEIDVPMQEHLDNLVPAAWLRFTLALLHVNLPEPIEEQVFANGSFLPTPIQWCYAVSLHAQACKRILELQQHEGEEGAAH
jgi:hypothetical protein